MLYEILNDDQAQADRRDKELDFALQIGEKGRFRVKLLLQHARRGRCFSAAFPRSIKSFEELNLPPVLREISATARVELVLVTGPTGSGKSTTLAAMIDLSQTVARICISSPSRTPSKFVHPRSAAS
jgi:twitching motility protein PilT